MADTKTAAWHTKLDHSIRDLMTPLTQQPGDSAQTHEDSRDSAAPDWDFKAQQPNMVLAAIALVLFLMGLLEMDLPQPETISAYEMACPIIKKIDRDPKTNQSYGNFSQVCHWIPKAP